MPPEIRVLQVFAQLFEALARKLFRSFETSEAFLEEVDELRQQRPQQKFVFLLFDAGMLELLALRYFFKKRWGTKFELRRTLGYPALLVNPLKENLNRFFSIFGLTRNRYSVVGECAKELNEGRPLLINLPIGFRAGKVTSQERLLEYLLSNSKNDIVLLPVVFIWRRVGKKVEIADVDLSTRLIKTLKSPILTPWYLLLGDPQKPLGLRKLIMMVRGYSRSIVRVATVIDATPESTLQSVRRESIRAIQKEKRVVLGPVYRPSRGVWEQILRNPEFLASIQKLSIEEGISEAKLLRRAQSNLKEIAADYSYSAIEVIGWVLEKVFHSIYQGFTFDKEQMKRIRDISKEGVIVFVPNHRSYLDFLVLSYFLFREQMPPAHVAAGINLNFWPVGRIFKQGGAFFIRRSFRGDKLYSDVLRRYVLALLNNRINVEFFIEGMRSRVGKMTPPKYGLLKMIVEGHLEGKISEKVFLVPVSITYDRVTEDRAHKRELEGGVKKKENVLNAVRASFKVLLKRYGRVHLRFGEPLKLDDAVAEFRSKHNEAEENFGRWVVPRIAFEVCHRLNRQTPVTAAGLVMTVLIARPGAAQSRLELEKWLTLLEQDITRLGYTKEPELEAHYLTQCGKALRRLIRDGIVQEYQLQDGGMGLKIVESERVTALYYRNTAIHAFLLPAIWGMCKKNPEQALELRKILRFEFFFQNREDFLASLKALPPDMPYDFYAYLLEDVIENIFWDLTYLIQRSDLRLDEKEWAARLLKFGQEKLIEGEMRRRESVNTYSVKAFIEMAKHEGWLVADAKVFSVELNEDVERTRLLCKNFLQTFTEWEQIKLEWLKPRVKELSV